MRSPTRPSPPGPTSTRARARLAVPALATTLIACAFAAALPPGCKARTFGTSSAKAINIREGNTVSRVYMAYDENAPSRVSWYYCKDEPLDTNTVVDVPLASSAHAILEVGRALRDRPEPRGPADEEERAWPAAPSDAVLGDASRRSVFLDERLTLSDFADTESGKGCQQLIGPGVFASARGAADDRLSSEGAADEIAGPMFTALASCAGLTKESLTLGSVVLAGNTDTIKGLLGFRGAKITSQNVGGTIVSLFSGAVFCGFGSKNLFKKLSEVQDVHAVSNKVFLSYFDGVVRTADAVFTAGMEGDAAEGVRARVRALPPALRDGLRADSTRFNALLRENKALEASALFLPYVVGTWNFLHARDVAPTPAATSYLMDSVRGFLDGLARRLGVPADAPAGNAPGQGVSTGT